MLPPALPAPLRRMLKHNPEFVRFKQEHLHCADGQLRHNALELIQKFWKERGFYVDWQLACGDVLLFSNITLVENLS